MENGKSIPATAIPRSRFHSSCWSMKITASAAEIFTGAVKDYGIGTIVGTTTFGKGIVQNTFQLSDGSVVKLTIAHYYTPLGNDIHKVGITPDVEVELPDDATSDVQLEKALEVVKGLESAE